MKKFPPERIVCLTEETVETLYLLGEQKRIVGVTGYAVRPKNVRKEKPRVGSFVSANFKKIKDFCLKKGIDLLIVGPEKPLVNVLLNFLVLLIIIFLDQTN